MKSHYQPTDEDIWVGRITDPTEGIQYWYQKIKCIDFKRMELSTLPGYKIVALIGYANDEGVRRNQGRPGAKEGPKAIRQQLGKLAWHNDDVKIYDLGDTVCDDNDMEASQTQLATMVECCLSENIFPMVFGGGHDVAFGTYTGLHAAIQQRPKKRIGIINFDAHFDLRPMILQGNSGTPFSQILELSGHQQAQYMAIGIQTLSNTKSLFDQADKLGVQYVLSTDCHLAQMDDLKEMVQQFIDSCDWIYISIDMDGFSSAYAPGVSAPSAFGFNPNFVLTLLSYIFSSGKVIACDWAELNPRFDIDMITAKLVASLVGHVVGFLNRAE